MSLRALSWRRLPLRIKLTLVFVAVMGVVLAAIGSFLYFRTKDNLDTAIRQSLRSRSGDLRQSVRAQINQSGATLIEPGERFAQVLNTRGTVVESRPQGAPPLLRRDELARSARGRRFIERPEHSRLLVAPVHTGNGTLLTVVDASLAEREHALEALGGALLIGGPLALLIAAALSYFVSGAALRPVELMRIRASQISAADPETRLPVPESTDEIHRLASTLNDMLDRLARAAEHERAFVANASHELRTPIATIRTELELAERHADTVDEFRDATRAAVADAEDLGRLADDLLVLASADHDKLPVRLQDTDLDQALESAVAAFRSDPLLGERDIVVEPTGKRVTADPDRLAQALTNMLGNAVIHGTGTITAGVDTAGSGEIEIWVANEGQPLPDTILRTAFDRFSRAPGAIDRPGAGLGLAIVREIANAHGGTARLENVDARVRCVLMLPTPIPPPA
jgi:two-component system OmpR family sensor kinase